MILRINQNPKNAYGGRVRERLNKFTYTIHMCVEHFSKFGILFWVRNDILDMIIRLPCVVYSIWCSDVLFTSATIHFATILISFKFLSVERIQRSVSTIQWTKYKLPMNVCPVSMSAQVHFTCNMMSWHWRRFKRNEKLQTINIAITGHETTFIIYYLLLLSFFFCFLFFIHFISETREFSFLNIWCTTSNAYESVKFFSVYTNYVWLKHRATQERTTKHDEFNNELQQK